MPILIKIYSKNEENSKQNEERLKNEKFSNVLCMVCSSIIEWISVSLSFIYFLVNIFMAFILWVLDAVRMVK